MLEIKNLHVSIEEKKIIIKINSEYDLTASSSK